MLSMIRPALSTIMLSLCVFTVVAAPGHLVPVEDFEEFRIGDGSEVGVWEVAYDRGSTEVAAVMDSDPLLSGGSSRVLRISGKNSSYSVLMRTPFRRITESPILSWKWKITEYPEGANISDLSVDDSAAQMYVNLDLKCSYLWYPCILSICYFYGSTMEPGETFLWSGFGTYVKFISIRSAERDGVDAWFHENRDVVEDYHTAVRDFLNHENRRTRERFRDAYESAIGESVMLDVHSVAIWVDSNDTKSTAESYWDDVEFLAGERE